MIDEDDSIAIVVIANPRATNSFKRQHDE